MNNLKEKKQFKGLKQVKREVKLLFKILNVTSKRLEQNVDKLGCGEVAWARQTCNKTEKDVEVLLKTINDTTVGLKQKMKSFSKKKQTA